MSNAAAAHPAPVPILDLRRQYAEIRREIEDAVLAVMREGIYILGPRVSALEAEIAAYAGVRHAIGCANGSDALLLALMALGVGPGDEVIVPAFTFFATAGAVSRLGAKPVFADIQPDTFNIDPADVAERITDKTRAIIPVHLFGQCADMAELLAVADRHDLPVIEDNAQALGASCGYPAGHALNGKAAGAMGSISTLSFYPTKNFGAAGDAGMMLTDDDAHAETLRCLRVHGESGPRYHFQRIGFNSRLDAVQAAVLLVKLKYLEHWNYLRNRLAQRYDEALADIEDLRTPARREGFRHVYHHYTLATPRRDELMAYLKERGVQSAVYYPIPLHLQPCFAALGGKPGDLPECERASREVLSIPVVPEITDDEQTRVITAIRNFFQA